MRGAAAHVLAALDRAEGQKDKENRAENDALELQDPEETYFEFVENDADVLFFSNKAVVGRVHPREFI